MVNTVHLWSNTYYKSYYSRGTKHVGSRVLMSVEEAYLPVKVLHLTEAPIRKNKWWK